MASIEGRRLKTPRLVFDPAYPNQVDTRPYNGLRRWGPYDTSTVGLGQNSLLFVFPATNVDDMRAFARALMFGLGNYPGFEEMFRVELTAKTAITDLSIDVDPRAAAHEGRVAYRRGIETWLNSPERPGVDLAIVAVPESNPWETDRPYYEAKALLSAAGIPTQMVTVELITDRSRLNWSVANIALAAFAKLGGVPWAVETPADDVDVVIGVGRSDVRTPDDRRRIFGYAVSFVADGRYRHVWSFRPAAREEQYRDALQAAVASALRDREGLARPPSRFIFHLASRTGRTEIDAVRRALDDVGHDIPAAFLRIDDSSLYDIMDFGQATLVPPKGVLVRLSPYRALLQTEGPSKLAPPRGPILVELDRRSDVGPDALEGLVEQVFRLSSANWRGFNARAKPVTLVYGQRLAQLVGYLEQVQAWRPERLVSDLQRRPWFL